MLKSVKTLGLAAVIGFTGATFAQADVVIDGFSNSTGAPQSTDTATSADSGTLAVGGVLGGNRQIIVTQTAPADGSSVFSSLSIDTVNHKANLSSDTGVTSNWQLVYSGTATDLTDSGSANSLGIDFLSADFGGSLTVTASDGTNTSTKTLSIPAGPSTLSLLFSSFTGSADFSAISSLTYSFTGDVSGDYAIQLLDSHFTTLVPSPAALPAGLIGLGALAMGRRRRHA